MCNSGYFLSYVDALGTSCARSFLANTHERFPKGLDRELRQLYARLPWSAEIYKKKLPCIFQATNEVMFLSWSLIKRQKPFLCNTFILKLELTYLPEMRVDLAQPVRQRNHRRMSASCTLVSLMILKNS